MGRLTLTTLAVITALTLTSCASTPTPVSYTHLTLPTSDLV